MFFSPPYSTNHIQIFRMWYFQIQLVLRQNSEKSENWFNSVWQLFFRIVFFISVVCWARNFFDCAEMCAPFQFWGKIVRPLWYGTNFWDMPSRVAAQFINGYWRAHVFYLYMAFLLVHTKLPVEMSVLHEMWHTSRSLTHFGSAYWRAGAQNSFCPYLPDQTAFAPLVENSLDLRPLIC